MGRMPRIKPTYLTFVALPVLAAAWMGSASASNAAQQQPPRPSAAQPSTAQPSPTTAGQPAAKPTREQILRGRDLVLDHGCADCHGGGPNPAATGFLAGSKGESDFFPIGPCATQPGATPCFKTRARNLTPDNTTGLGRFSERQIFNAIRYGLRPGETPDVQITGNTPGQGNFPQNPKFLAPPMPWPAFRHMSDQELMDIAAYLKHGLKPVRNRVVDSEGPPDFWASEYTAAKIGPYPAAPYPTANERVPE